MGKKALYLPVFLTLALTVCLPAEPVRLTALERSQGWRLLFDGNSASDWRGYRTRKLPPNWQVTAGSLIGTPGPALASGEEFADFELSFDWKVEAGGRGEVFVRASEDVADPADAGPVMELAGHGETLGGNGGLTPLSRSITPQYDVWYQTRIVVFGTQVEHWINGEQVLSYRLDSADWRGAVAASGRKVGPDFGRLPAGRIVLAGDGVHFRNIKLKSL